MLRSRSFPIYIKIGIYKTLIRPIIFYGAEARNFSEDICERLRAYEGKIVRRVYRATYTNGLLRIRFKCVLRTLYEHVDIAAFVKIEKTELEWTHQSDERKSQANFEEST